MEEFETQENNNEEYLPQEENTENQLPDMSDVSSMAEEFAKQNDSKNAFQQFTDDLRVNARDFVDNRFQGDQRSKEEIRADQEAIFAQKSEDMAESQEVLNEQKGVVPETIRSVSGGIIDTAESLGNFAYLSKDTLETGMKHVLGQPVKDTENPFHENYKGGSYFEMPDVYEPENKTNIGKMARGLIEFGLLVRLTGGVGGIGKATLTKAGLTNLGVLRSGSKFIASNKPLQFISKAGRVFGEGGAAELISQSSEGGNIINLANQYTPWLVPPIVNRLAVDDNDSVWEAKLKTVAAGGGLNHIGWYVSAFFRHAPKAAKAAFDKAKKSGKSLDEAVQIGNEAGTNELKRQVLREMLNQERAAQKLAKVKNNLGIGVDPTDPLDKYIRNHLDEDDLKAYSELIEFNSLEGVDRVQFAKNQDEIIRYTDLAKRIGARKGDVWDDIKYSSTDLDLENVGRQPDAHVNPELFDDIEKVTYAKNVDAIEDVVTEAKTSPEIETNLVDEADILNHAKGPSNTSPTRASNTAIGKELIDRAAGGDKNLREIFQETVDDISKRMAKTYSGEDYEALAIQAVRRAEPILESIAGFTQGKIKDLKRSYTTRLRIGKKKGDEFRTFSYGKDKDGNSLIIDTIGPVQKDANLIILRSLGKTMANLSAGTLEISNGMSVFTNFEKLADLMKVVFEKTKEYQYAWGLDGQLQQAGDLKRIDTLRANKNISKKLLNVSRDADKLHDNMIKLLKEAQKTGDDSGLQDLIRMFELSDGDVLSLEDLAVYLNSKVFGGTFFGFHGKKGARFKALPSQTVQELYGVMYNGLLSRIGTPVKAIFGTGFLGGYRGFMKAVGIVNPYRLYRNKFTAPQGFRELIDVNAPRYTEKEVAVAFAEIDGLFASLGESMAMFKRNYNLGRKGMDTDYTGRYAIKRNKDNFVAHGDFVKRYGNFGTQIAYRLTRGLQELNTNAFARHSTISMAAGDAAARTSIGHQMMYARAARDLIEDGVDPRDLKKYLPLFKEQYRNKIFKKIDDSEDGIGIWVTKDKMAKLAGDEATLTKSLTGTAKAFEVLASTIPGSRLFFKFLTPAVNGLELAFLHTPFGLANKKYRALVTGNLEELEKLGIAKADIPQEIAFMEGRMATGTIATALAIFAASRGQLTGDYPRDPGKRAMWIQAGIKPNSLMYKNPITGDKVYISFQKLEIFNVLFNLVGNMAENAHVLGQSLMDEGLAKLSIIFGELLVNNGPMGGLEELVGLFTSENPASRIESTIAAQGASFIPMTGAMNDFADLADGTVKEAQSMNEKFMRRSGAAELFLPQKYDIFNEERTEKKLYMLPENILLRGFNLISPVGIDFEKSDPVTDFLMEIEYDLNANLTSIDGVELTATELSEFNRLLATDKFLRKDLLRVINSKPVQRSLKDYKEQRKKTNQGVMSKDGLAGVFGDEVGGFDVKKEPFYYEIDNVFKAAKNRAKTQMLLPGTPFSDLKNPESLRSRIFVPKLRNRLNKQGFSASETNKEVERIIELGGSTP